MRGIIVAALLAGVVPALSLSQHKPAPASPKGEEVSDIQAWLEQLDLKNAGVDTFQRKRSETYGKRCGPDSRCGPGERCGPDSRCGSDTRCGPDGRCGPDTKAKRDNELRECNCSGGGGNFFKRALCKIRDCMTNYLPPFNIPINRPCPLYNHTTTPVATSTATVTSPTATGTIDFSTLLPSDAPPLQSSIPFQGASNANLSIPALLSPYIEGEVVYDFDTSTGPAGGKTEQLALTATLNGINVAHVPELAGRTPVVYQAQLDQWNVSELLISANLPNDPHGLLPVTLREVSPAYPDEYYQNIAFARRNTNYPSNTAYAQDATNPNVEWYALVVMFCGQLPAGYANVTQAYDAGLTVYGSLYAARNLDGIRNLKRNATFYDFTFFEV